MLQRPNNSASDYRPLQDHYRRLNLVISESKVQMGSIITFIGFELNFSSKTIRIKSATLKNTYDRLAQSLSMSKTSFGFEISVSKLEKLLGNLEFCSNISLVGRTRTSNLTSLLNEARRCKSATVLIDSPGYSELQYWHSYCLDPVCLPFLSENLAIYQISYSDASGGSDGRWGYLKYSQSTDDEQEKLAGSGPFPTSYCDASIHLKETFALWNLVINLPPNSNNLVMVDSQVLLFIWRKTRSSKDLLINRFIEMIFLELQRKNSCLELQWISTKQMNEVGADRLSRGDYEQISTTYSLSTKGVQYVRSHYFPVDFDIFGSAANYFPESRFYSCYDIQHPNFCGNDGQYCLTHSLKGQYLLFPPIEFTRQSLFLLSQNRSTKYSIVIIVRSNYLELVRNLFQSKLNFTQVLFEKPSQSRPFHVNVKLSRYGLVCCSYGPRAPPKAPEPFILTSVTTSRSRKRKNSGDKI